ncbi:MAG TPA: helix-hairpin-helix domain-containing protein [Longimicrobium sp.]|jgi:DNA uptake protein ComE-like DNA-binding protein|uniref:type II secretion system protein GspK n=1 Tax=Longimicrobium sp. TaxID=2029185 RepID=UPI002ED7C225
MNRSILTVALCALAATAACGGESETDEGVQGTATTMGPAATDSPAAAAAAPAATTPAPAPAAGAMLDPNTATREQLAAVPGLTPQLADAIIAGRPYQDMRGVNTVLASLSEAQRDQVYTQLWKPLDLNTATAEEIELIPNMSARMRHEFEEYRPYRGIEQFRREIGKYVDDAEVARLERYVTIAGT